MIHRRHPTKPIRVSKSKLPSLAENVSVHTPKTYEPEHIKMWCCYYPSGNIRVISYTYKGKLHHYFKPALSFYRDDANNTLVREYYYEHGIPSKTQAGVFGKVYTV